MATNVLDINPLEHLTGDIAKSQYNYESILNGLVNWNNSKDDIVTIRLATTSEPWFRDINLFTRYYYTKNAGSTVSEKALPYSKYAYNSRYRIVAGVGENVVLRVNVIDLGGVKTWNLYEDVSIYDETNKVPDSVYTAWDRINEQTVFAHDLLKDTYVWYSYTGYSSECFIKLCRLKRDVTAGSNIDPALDLDDVVVVLPSTNGVPGNEILTNHLLAYKDKVYIKRGGSLNSAKSVEKIESGYVPYCDIYQDPPTVPDADYVPTEYSYGDYVYYLGEFFVYVNDNSSSVPPFTDDTTDDATPVKIRQYNTDYWKSVYLLPTRYTIQGSGTLRFTVDTDINGFVLKNGTTKQVSNDKTDIGMAGSLKLAGGTSKEHSGVDIFYTSNYAEWPGQSPKWVEGSGYVTDGGKNAYSLQSYSAVMLFNHADPAVKQRNIINYDGPDLDQGLCIMLPCEVGSTENGTTVVKTPTDGMTFEFVINIWPNHAYDGREYNDLIINKSQVYVYSVRNWDDYKAEGMGVSTVTPIAKFSMARLTNFYVHDENVGVPDRPVVYKATFIYSESEARWKTYDYYQFPDHILLSPYGFVDPMSKEAYDVQSAGFPLFQNPFSNYNLSPIHVSNAYRNQLQEDSREQPST